MQGEASTLQDMKGEVQGIVGAISVQANLIAEELLHPRKIDKARVFAAQNAITHHVNLLRPCLQEFDKALHAFAQPIEAAGGTRRIAPPDWLAFSAKLGLIRNAANEWSSIRQLISEQLPPRRLPLEPVSRRVPPNVTAAAEAGDRAFDRLRRMVNPHAQTESAKQQGSFPDIALPQSDFLALALAAWRLLKAQGRAEKSRFIDVGCGSGVKVVSALEFFTQAFGLEIDPAYAGAARGLFETVSEGMAELIEGNALDFASYDHFDVIYFYRPISNDEKLQQLEEKIASTARPGTILIAPYRQFSSRAEALGCAPITPRIYLAQTGPRKAASLRRDAEFVGINTAPTPRALRSIWDPIVSASRRRGF
ncbi:class I SAM-dependent methyltransferase [Tropicimonas sp. TH_r6]|uniref:class I SAM-dependent methyltransferase n=1 Tax=Tropicimonas sp. TH_r6 TaxID=3082085 RepID=UPI0029531E07|nr:class I SAM-dependent methyltransferase [Tropicimonas sp. TH_r6]MDV7144248.1 class I SAM-dependent methyltransferase [Tropicimonas sp. TH_r6]